MSIKEIWICVAKEGVQDFSYEIGFDIVVIMGAASKKRRKTIC